MHTGSTLPMLEKAWHFPCITKQNRKNSSSEVWTCVTLTLLSLFFQTISSKTKRFAINLNLLAKARHNFVLTTYNFFKASEHPLLPFASICGHLSFGVLEAEFSLKPSLNLKGHTPSVVTSRLKLKEKFHLFVWLASRQASRMELIAIGNYCFMHSIISPSLVGFIRFTI